MAVSAVRSLHGGESPWWIDLTAPGGSAFSAVLRCPSSRIGPEMIATNAAALAVAEEHGLPAPRLLAADPDGRTAETPVSLETVVPGTSAWPAAPDTGLLLAAGAAIARVHAVTPGPRPQLRSGPAPSRSTTSPGIGERRAPTTALLHLADERVRAAKGPGGPVVLVHGDVWPGNTVVAGGRIRGLIDWKTAGVGNPGVDLGELRKQVAISYDDDAPGLVLEGWERAVARGRRRPLLGRRSGSQHAGPVLQPVRHTPARPLPEGRDRAVVTTRGAVMRWGGRRRGAGPSRGRS
ncbi:phosphotransferase family protein [Nonomuraea thailandensis]